MIAAGIPETIYGGAGVGAFLLGAGYFLLRTARLQSKTLGDLLNTTTARVDVLEKENRDMRLAQRWCDHRLSECMRILASIDGLTIPAEFYGEHPPERLAWPRIGKK